MPKTTADHPEKLRPYFFHHCDITYQGTADAHGTCPFCGREDKFFISQAEGLYECKTCDAGLDGKSGGNIYTFLRKLHQLSGQFTTDQDLVEVSVDRKVSVPTLRAWGWVKSIIDGEWLVPGPGPKGLINNLYRWAKLTNGKRAFIVTATMPQCLFGGNLWDDNKQDVFVCEGISDAMALWELLGKYKFDNSVDPPVLVPTTDPTESVLSATNVVAVPGCKVFVDDLWTKLSGRNGYLAFDNDHPRKHPKTGADIAPAAFAGLQVAAIKLLSNPAPPKTLRYLKWGDAGYDLELPNGYDTRDDLHLSTEPENVNLQRYIGRFEDVPPSWLQEAGVTPGKPAPPPIQGIECTSYDDLVAAWRQEDANGHPLVHWSDSVDVAFTFMLAIIVSTKQQGAQVWGRVIGPPGATKSTLCEGLMANKKYIYSMSMQTGFHSGQSGFDLWQIIDGMTVVINEGDMLVTAPNLSQTLSQIRDSWGGQVHAQYRNGVSYSRIGMRTTYIVAGTDTLRKLNRSAAGDRFLDCIIFERASKGGIDKDEQEMLDAAARAELACCDFESDGKPESQDDPRKVIALGKTIGFINYLREVAAKNLQSVYFDDESVDNCKSLARLIANMRARPIDDKSAEEETTVPEVATRLTRQLIRLAKCMAVVLNRTLDDEVMRRVAKIGKDTSHGITFRIVRTLQQHGALDIRGISARMHLDDQKVSKGLAILRELGCVRLVERLPPSGAKGRTRFVHELTPGVRGMLHVLRKLLREQSVTANA